MRLISAYELKVETTICHEIRQSHQAVVIDHVAEDEIFAGHHTPAMYGSKAISLFRLLWQMARSLARFAQLILARRA